MAEYQVTCINKQPRNDTHEGITHIGGSGWRLTRAEAVAHVRAGTHSFFTNVNGKRAEVGVPENTDYLRTHADGYYSNDLLAFQNAPDRILGSVPVWPSLVEGLFRPSST
jgi:hypothetical protein